MGGPGSGWYNKPKVKSTNFKIYCFETDGVPFYYGVAKGFLCKIKSYYIWRSKNRVKDTQKNVLFDYIQSIDYKFDIKQLEILPGYTSKEARLLLQEKYLNCKGENVVNKLNFCFCPKVSNNPRLPEEMRQNIINDYINGITTGEIALKYNINKRKVNTLVRYNKCNKQALFKKAIEDYKSGMEFWQVVSKYHLSGYMQKKLTDSL